MTTTNTSFAWRPITSWQPAEQKQIEARNLERGAVSFPLGVISYMHTPYNDIIKTEFINKLGPAASAHERAGGSLCMPKYGSWSPQPSDVMEKRVQESRNWKYFCSVGDNFYICRWSIASPVNTAACAGFQTHLSSLTKSLEVSLMLESFQIPGPNMSAVKFLLYKKKLKTKYSGYAAMKTSGITFYQYQTFSFRFILWFFFFSSRFFKSTLYKSQSSSWSSSWWGFFFYTLLNFFKLKT